MKKSQDLPRLVERAKNGDEQAFAQLYDRFSKPVYFNALKYLRNESDARDVLQEVMLDLFRHIGSIREPELLHIYLYRAAYNKSMNLLKQSSPLLLAEDADFLEDTEPEENEEFIPQQFLENKERREYIVSLVEELRPNYKSALLMYYFDELSVREIAEIMGATTYSVKVWLQRGRASLRRKLDQNTQKERVLRAMSVPALTQILHENADALFTQEVGSSVWHEISGQLGFSAATAATATASVAGGGAAAATAATAATVSGVKLAAVLVTSGVVAASLWGAVHSISPKEASSPIVNPAISSGQSPGANIEQDPTPLEGSIPFGSGQSISSDSTADPHTPPTSAEATTSVELSDDMEADSPLAPFTISGSTLTYPRGTTLTEAQILADAGVDAAGFDGTPLVYGLEEIDCNIPDHYAVLVQIPDGRQRAVIIIIEP